MADGVDKTMAEMAALITSFEKDWAPWCNGQPYYCDCGCGGPYHECEQPDSRPEPDYVALERHARQVLKQEFDR